MNTEGALNFQIALEQRIAKIYQRIGDQFPSKALSINKEDNLWKNLARDERKHAALLKIEKAFLKTGARVTNPVEINDETQKKIEAMLSRYEEQITHGITEAEAIQILKDLEACDEEFFLPLLRATDSKLLSQFSDYSQSYRTHERRVQKGLSGFKNQMRRKTDKQPKEENPNV